MINGIWPGSGFHLNNVQILGMIPINLTKCDYENYRNSDMLPARRIEGTGSFPFVLRECQADKGLHHNNSISNVKYKLLLISMETCKHKQSIPIACGTSYGFTRCRGEDEVLCVNATVSVRIFCIFDVAR